MIKKQQKWIALIVAVTFMWLLQVSNMPLNAAGSSEQASSANAEQGPDYFEAISQKAAPAKKKSILPLILIGVGVLGVTAALYFFVLKTNYDITGSWNFVFTLGSTDIPFTFNFIGTKDSGTYSTTGNPALAGTYTVDKKNVTMTVNGQSAIQFSGQFTDKNTMNGIYVESSKSLTWKASR